MSPQASKQPDPSKPQTWDLERIEKYKRDRQESDNSLKSLDYDLYLDLYRERDKETAAARYNLDRNARKIFGNILMEFGALALDPFQKFQITRNSVCKVNRKKSIPGITGHSRSYTYKTPNSTVAYQTVHGVPSPDFNLQDDTPKGGAALVAQPNIDGFLYDTSYKTRQQRLVTQGEMEMYIPSLRTTPWSYTWRERDNVSINDAPPITTYHARSIKDHFTSVRGVTQRIAKVDHDNWLTGYRINALASLNQRAPGVVAKCLPTSRSFNLLYNIAELRELPKLLRDAVVRLRSMEKTLHDLQNPGSLYLEYKFAWESTVRSIRDMLKMPERISKRINYLLSRNGKLTTLRYRYSYSEPLSSIPAFNYEIYPFDVVLDSASLSGVHKVEIRAAVNSRIVLPNIDVPQVKEKLLLRLWGLDPKPSDVYNLIPWTWLLDWFANVGEYVSIIETMLNDKSLVNYGLVSFVSEGEMKSSLKLKADGSKATAITGQATVIETIKYRPSRDASLFFRYHLRRSVTHLDGVKITSEFDGLSDSQKAILTALLTKFGEGRGGGNVTGNPSV